MKKPIPQYKCFILKNFCCIISNKVKESQIYYSKTTLQAQKKARKSTIRVLVLYEKIKN